MFDFTKFKTEQDKADFHIKLFNQLKGKRQNFEGLWDVEQKIFHPRRYDMLRQSPPGQQYGSKIYDSHPAVAASKFTLGLLGYMMSRAVPWLGFTATKQQLMTDDDVKEYCQGCAEQVLSSFNRTNFYGSSVWFGKDSSVIGTAVSLPEEDLLEGQIHYNTIHPGEVYIFNDQYGNLGGLHRPFKMTAINILAKFGKDKLPSEIVDNATGKSNGNPFAEYDILLAYYKNINPRANSIRSEDKTWKVFYILRVKDPKKPQILQETGTDYGPICYRPGREPGLAYGTSLAADALTPALIVNKLGKKGLQAIHRMIEPPIVASQNLRTKLHTNAGGRTWSANLKEENYEEKFQNIKWPYSDAQMARIHADIDDIFFVRFFEMLTSGDMPQMTAYEVSQRMGEKAVLMGTIVELFEKEFLEQAVKTQWDFETAAGRMPDAPDILLEEGYGEMEINYIGPLAQLQRSMLKSKGIIDALAIIQAIGQIWPQSLIKINELDLIEEAAVAQGMSQKLIKSDAQVKEVLDDINRKEQLAEQLQIAETAGKVLPSASKEVEPNSPLLALTGGQG